MDIYFEKTLDGKKKYQSICDFIGNKEELKKLEERTYRHICYCNDKRGLRKVIEYFQPFEPTNNGWSIRHGIPGEIKIIKINQKKFIK